MHNKSQQEVGRLLGDLIAIPSVNPHGDPQLTQAPYGEGRLADYAADYFRALGVEVQRQEVLPGRENVLVHLSGQDPSLRPLLLEAHMDTVEVEGMESPFTPRLEGGRLYGRGACDNKGSLAAMMTAVRRVVEEKAALRRDCWLVGAADEEFGMQGVLGLIKLGMPFAGAVIGEPTRLHLVPATDGQMYFNVVAQGKAAHTSNPQHGINAIYLMTKVIDVLRRRSDEAYPKRLHPLCGPPKLTVSMVSGGTSEHMVPERCQVSVDRRVIPGESSAQALEEIRGWMAAELDAETVRRIEVRHMYKDVPPMETPTDHPLVQALHAAVANTLGDAQISGVAYNTDASYLAESGVPCVVFGPGDIAQAHSAVEFVEVEQVEAAAEILQRFLMDGVPSLR